jgi:hypothetical protein
VVSRITLVLYSVMMVNIKETKWVNYQGPVKCDLTGCVCMLCNADRLCNHIIPTTEFLDLRSGLISAEVEKESPRLS